MSPAPRERGYRTNVDALLLAAFAGAPASRATRRPAAARPRALRVWDLGAGEGAVALLLGQLRGPPAPELTLLERDPGRAALARQHLERAGAPGRVLELDVRALPADARGVADLVVCNPPWFASGSASPTPSRASARSGDALPFLIATRALLAARAEACWIHPARTLTSLLVAARKQGLEPKRLRLVHAFLDRPARAALVAFKAGRAGGLVVEPPLVEWDAPGRPTPELAAWRARCAVSPGGRAGGRG